MAVLEALQSQRHPDQCCQSGRRSIVLYIAQAVLREGGDIAALDIMNNERRTSRLLVAPRIKSSSAETSGHGLYSGVNELYVSALDEWLTLTGSRAFRPKYSPTHSCIWDL